MSTSKHASVHERWAHLRFSVVGQLLAAPAAEGRAARRAQEVGGSAPGSIRSPESRCALPLRPSSAGCCGRAANGAIRWRCCGARCAPTPASSRWLRLSARRCARSTRAHPSWSVQLHYDNLRALAEQDSALAAGALVLEHPALIPGAGLAQTAALEQPRHRWEPSAPRRAWPRAKYAATRRRTWARCGTGTATPVRGRC